MIKPWPNCVHTEGLLVDANTMAPPVDVEIIETPPHSPLTHPGTLHRSLSDFGTTTPRSSDRNSKAEATPRRAPLQRSHTHLQSRQRRTGFAVNDLINKFKTHTAPSTVFHSVLEMANM